MPTYARVEIPKKVKLEVFERAGGPGNVCCEGECKMPLRGKRMEYHHAKAEWLQNEPPASRPPIVAADVLLLCIPCHAAISSKDTTRRAAGKRIVEKQAGITRSKRGGFNSKFKKKMNGDLVNKETGEVIRRGRS